MVKPPSRPVPYATLSQVLFYIFITIIFLKGDQIRQTVLHRGPLRHKKYNKISYCHKYKITENQKQQLLYICKKFIQLTCLYKYIASAQPRLSHCLAVAHYGNCMGTLRPHAELWRISETIIIIKLVSIRANSGILLHWNLREKFNALWSHKSKLKFCTEVRRLLEVVFMDSILCRIIMGSPAEIWSPEL